MNCLPEILMCGIYESSAHYPTVKKTKQRKTEVFELEFFFENSGVSVLNGVEYPIRNGSLLFAKPGDVRCSYLHFKAYYIHFDVSDPNLRSALMNVCGFWNPMETKHIKETIIKIINLFYSANVLDNYAAGAELVSLLMFINKLDRSGSGDSNILNSAQKFIKQHYSEKISVVDIAAYCNISETHLYRIFKNSIACTPNDYLLDIRLSAARQLLCSTNLSVNEIAMSCGFNAQSYFSDCFKRKNDMPPSVLRKRYRYPY